MEFQTFFVKSCSSLSYFPILLGIPDKLQRTLFLNALFPYTQNSLGISVIFFEIMFLNPLSPYISSEFHVIFFQKYGSSMPYHPLFLRNSELFSSSNMVPQCHFPHFPSEFRLIYLPGIWFLNVLWRICPWNSRHFYYLWFGIPQKFWKKI